MKIKNLSALIAFISAIMLFIGCGSSAHIEKDNTVLLSNYKTYNWILKSDSAGKKQVNTIPEQNLRNSVDQEMEKNGYKKVTRNPDLLLTYDVLVDRKRVNESNPVYSTPYTRLFYNPYSGRYSTLYFPSQFMGYNNSSATVKEGTVSISMIDAKTDKTIWQGWSTDQMYNNYITSKEAERDVRSIFRKFNTSK